MRGAMSRLLDQMCAFCCAFCVFLKGICYDSSVPARSNDFVRFFLAVLFPVQRATVDDIGVSFPLRSIHVSPLLPLIVLCLIMLPIL